MLNKSLQLSILFHLILIFFFVVVAKYQKPVTRIQVTLVPNVPSITKETKAKSKAVKPKPESPKKPMRKFHNIVIKNFKEKEASPTIVKKPEILKPKKTPLPEKKLAKINTPLKTSKASTKENIEKNKLVILPNNVKDSSKVSNEEPNMQTIPPVIKKDYLPTLNNIHNEKETEELNKEVIPKDLTELDLSDADKQILAKNLSNCVAGLPAIREHDEVLFLSFTINEDAIIENVDIIRNNQKVPKEQLNNLEQRVVSIFQSKACSKLILPPDGFNIWHEFSVKLRLEGFFNE